MVRLIRKRLVLSSIFLLLGVGVLPLQAQDVEALEKQNEEMMRSIATLKSLLGIREGKFTAVPPLGSDDEPREGKIVTRGTLQFSGFGMTIEQMVEIGGERTESLWIINRSPPNEPDGDDPLFTASVFDSDGVRQVFTGQWKENGRMLKWSNVVVGSSKAGQEAEPLREIEWTFSPDGQIQAVEVLAEQVGKMMDVSRYETKPAPERKDFPSLPSKEGIGIIGELSMSVGKWRNDWEVRIRRAGKVEVKKGKGAVESRFVLGGRFLWESYTPDEIGPMENSEQLVIVGAAKKADTHNLQMWTHGSHGAGEAIAVTWDKEAREFKINQTTHPTESLSVEHKSSSKFLNDDQQLMESRFHITTEDGFDELHQLKSRFKRLK